MSRQNNPKGLSLINAWAESVKQCALDGLNSEPGIFIWYDQSTNMCVGRNYCKGKVPGAQALPRPLRALIYGTEHSEYDMASSNLIIFTSFTPEGRAILCRAYLLNTVDRRADLLSNGIDPSLAKRAINSTIMSLRGYEAAKRFMG
eukprot:14156468-Heterocapsa_arctica.AAC.1